MHALFSMQGRCGRARYFWTLVLCNLITFVVGFAVGVGVAALGARGGVRESIGYIFSVPAVVIVSFAAVKRFHDLGRPGLHYWLLWIPFYNVYVAVELLLRPGVVGGNKYGPDPLAEVESP